MMSPLWAPLSLSFMTDVPAFAVQSVCIWLGARSLSAGHRTRLRWFAGSVVVGLFGVTIREYAVVAPAAVLAVFALTSWGRRDRRSLTVSWIVGATSAVVLALFIAWRRSWAASLSLQPSVPASIGDGASSFARSALFTVVTLAFLVLPAFAFVPMRRLVRVMTAARWALVAVVSAGIILVIGTITTWEWSPPLLGPYLDQRGALGNDILPGDRALLVPGLLLRVVLVVTLGAAILLVGLLVIEAADVVRRAPTWRERCAGFDAGTLAWFVVVLTVLSLTAAGALDLPIFDRYVLPAVPFAAGLVLAWKPAGVPLTARTSRNAVRWAAVVLFLFAGILWAADSGRFDAARWAAGERAVALGYPADRVDAGFEWRNVHRPAGESPMSPSQRDLDACVRLCRARRRPRPRSRAVVHGRLLARPVGPGDAHGVAGRRARLPTGPVAWLSMSTLHFEDEQAEIHKLVVGPMDNNVFVLRCKQTGEAALIDAANEHEKLLDLCKRLNVRKVYETHGHWDHIQAVPAVRDAGYDVGVTSADADMLDSYDFVLEDDTALEVGRLRLHTILTPGHTPGSICFRLEGSPVLFSGDTLFPGGPGNTSFEGGDFDTIIRSIDTKLFPLAEDTIVLPGPRRRHDDRQRAPAPAGMGRPRLVTPSCGSHDAGSAVRAVTVFGRRPSADVARG